MQRLLNHARWDADAVRDDLRARVVEHLGDPGGVLVVDETGFVKKSGTSAGVQRRYTGTVGKKENCQVGVFLGYASARGATLVDRELYLPESWTADRARRQQAAIPGTVGFQTKPQLARLMLERALAAEVPVAWVTGDEAYGGDARLRLWLAACQVPHVLAIKRTQHVIAMNLVPTPGRHHPCRAGRHRRDQVDGGVLLSAGQGGGRAGPLPGPPLRRLVPPHHLGDAGARVLGVLITPVQAPNANADAERWIRTVRDECLDWLLVVGRGHLKQVLRVYIEHYNAHWS